MSSSRSDHTFLHPASGGIILALDWLLFSGSALSLGLGTSVLASVGFVVGLLSVSFVQYRYGHEAIIASGLKGVLAGIAVGIPFPIAGTAVGGFVLTLSGLDRWKKRLTGRSSSDDAATQDPAASQSPTSDDAASGSASSGERARSSS